jgi:hypothetical protein
MRAVRPWLAGFVLAGLLGVLLLTPNARGGDVGFVEDFALAKDRTTALKQLIPGTEDYYYYHCLHYLHTAQFDKVVPMTGQWYSRHGQTARLTEIQTRHALLAYEKDPKKSLDYVRARLGLYFDHQKENLGSVPNFPVALDQNLIARATLKASSLSRWGNLDNFEDVALDWMAAEKLTPGLRRNLLARLQRPDIPDLPRLVADDLDRANKLDPQNFGAYPIHARMTLAQLDELLKLKPDLLNQSAFVTAYITKLQPGADEDWKRDRALARAYFERLQKFVDRLDPVHNPLKAHVLFHRLVFDRAAGEFDRARFLAYVKLPRFQPYMCRAWNERPESGRHPAHLNADYSGATLLPPVNADEALVRSYLKQFFLEDVSTKEFEPYIDDVWLRHLFAETKIENGAGDPEEWASKLPPELFRAFRDRIDIDFDFANKTDYAADEPVALDLFVKNVPNLLVKVFEVNTRTVYRTRLTEVDTDINLDGLVANSERSVKYDDSPLRRVPRKFEFPELGKPGVYVIDFIGGGKSSRALVRKGRLHALVTTGAAGQTVRVVDEKNRPVKDATVWLGGHEYEPDRDGAITVPFTAAPGRRPIVISRGDFSCLETITHQPEAYRLRAGFHVDRETLLTQRVAPVLVRPGLFLNDSPVSLKLLEEVRLRVVSVDHNDVPSSTEVPDFALFEDRDSVHDVRVPARLKSLTFTLSAKVKSIASGKPVELAVSQSFGLNEIERTDKIEDLHLAKFGPNYVVELLGRTGEARPDRPVRLAIKHREFKEQVQVTLKTDPLGRVNLGPLAEVVTVTATGPEDTAHTWTLVTDAHSYRALVHGKAGEVIALPYMGAAGKPSRAEIALLEVKGADVRADNFDSVKVENGQIELGGLAAGDYELWLKRDGQRIRIRVVDGPVVAGHVLGSTRHMQLPGLKPVSIQSVAADAEALTVRVRDQSKFTRVHVYATRYLPAFNAFGNLSQVKDAELGGVLPGRAESVYLTGRNIGDEYRYVLDRRGQRKFPGNMLERPSFLLNPWAVRTTETGEQLVMGGDDFRAGGRFQPPAEAPPVPSPGTPPHAQPGSSDFANLDFLADSSAVLLNLSPDKDGVVRLPRKELGPHAYVHVVAVDPLGTTYRSVSLPEIPAQFVDLRLKKGLDPARHFTQQKQVTVLDRGEEFTLADAAGSRFQTYDSLAKVYGFYSTLSKDPNFAEFAFVLTWPKLKPEEKRTLYSKYACHELNFFLMKKDPKFFAEAVAPYLRNKKDKTFLDHWLVDEDVSRYLKPWEYGRLNTAERVLLSQRIDGERDRTARHLNDMLRLLPPNTERQLFLFDAGVQAGSLATRDDVTADLQKKIQDLRESGEAKHDPKSKLPDLQPGDSAASGTFAPKPTAPPGAGFGAAPGGMPGRDTPHKDGRGDKKDTDKAGKAAEGYFEPEAEKRAAVRQLFRKLDPTVEWAENNYYKQRITAQVAGLVPVAPFWEDYARHAGKGPFLTREIGEASRNFTEMMFALAVLDLPFEAGKHDVQFAGGSMKLVPGSRMIAFHEEVRPAVESKSRLPILVSQNFYRHGDRFREENGERFDKFVTGEFVVHTVYGCQVVVTNPTSSRQRLSVLLQLPLGAIPVANGQQTRSVPLDLEPYHTKTIDYFFYFPRSGKFPHFPVHVAKNEEFVAAAQPVVLDVVEKPTRLDTTSWDHVSQHGTNDDVLAYLNRENVRALNLDKIAFRMKDRAFFEAVMRLLDARHCYNSTLWSYGIFHADLPAAREFLKHADPLVAGCGGPIVSPLLTIDPVERHQYEHLEYKPLVNARAHSLGKRRQIVNDAFHQQYHRFLTTLTYHATLDDADLLAVVYYLLLQDRVDEALDAFARVNPERVATRMQYDYCAAYLELFKDEPKKARAVATPYLFHPVDRWRNAFAAVVAQIDEIEGKGGKVVDGENRDQKQGGLAATEPGFEVAVNAQGVNLTWQNVEAVQVNYYLMDVELLFSTSPFVQRAGGQFATIKPNAREFVKLPQGRNKHTFPLPAEFDGRNVLVEVTAAGKTRAAPHLASTMTVNLSENYGQLRVTDNAAGKAVSKVYVKVYAKLSDGSVKFHKDGYTDLRGRFDYVSVNTPERQAVERFAILVLSEDRGAAIREVAPPQR